MALPASIVNGKTSTLGTRNSADDEVILLTESVQCPALHKVTGSSAKESMQTFPKSPESATIVTSLGAGALPETWTTLGLFKSSLVTVILANCVPTLVG